MGPADSVGPLRRPVWPPFGYGRLPTGTGGGVPSGTRPPRPRPAWRGAPYGCGGNGRRSQTRRPVRRPVTVAAMMTRMAATMMLMIHRIQSMPLVASTPRAAAT